MLKLIITGIWVAAVTLGSVYFSIQMAKAPDPAEDAAKKKAVQELVRGETITYPVIAAGKVEGYFLAKASYVTDKTKLGEIKLPIPELLTDELYTALVGDKIIRVGENRNFDLKTFKERMKQTLNQKLGSEVVLDVIIEQIDYITKQELQDNLSKAGNAMSHGQKLISEKAPDDIPVAKKDGGDSAGH
jgi:hypothetical protein